MNVSAPYFKIESFGAVDGPGIRLVVFLQGCPLRCIYCHNPESWELKSKLMITPNEIIAKFKRNRNYYRNGGITSSGGEPLIHQEFCLELSKLCHDEKINLAFDTSGANFNKNNISYFQNLIKYKPLWIVDIKHINPKKHKAITGTANQNELQLIKFLEKHKQKYWIRQVLVPGYTDDPMDLKQLGRFIRHLKYLTNFEILPYHKLGLAKYRDLNIINLLVKVNEPSKLAIKKAKQLISA